MSSAAVNANTYFADSDFGVFFYRRAPAREPVLVSYNAWSEIEITRTLEAICNSFTLKYEFSAEQLTPARTEAEEVAAALNAYHGVGGREIPLAGDELYIKYRGALAIRGFVDSVEKEHTPDGITFVISGRSRTSLIADSSCRITGVVMDVPELGITSHVAQFRNKKVEDIARTICAPFHLGVFLAPGVDTGEPIERLEIIPGQKVNEVLDILAKKRGLLMYATANGDVLVNRIASASTSPQTIEDFKRIKTVDAIGDSYLFYHVIGGDNTKVIGTASDLSWKPESAPRTLIIKEDTRDQIACQQTAYLERDTKWGRAHRLEIELAGWRTKDTNQPFKVGQFVTVDYKNLDQNSDVQWVATEVTTRYNLTDGHTTALVLQAPEALQLLGEPVKNKAVRLPKRSAVADWVLVLADSPTLKFLATSVSSAITAAKNGTVKILGSAPPSSPTTDAGRNAAKAIDRECSALTGDKVW